MSRATSFFYFTFIFAPSCSVSDEKAPAVRKVAAMGGAPVPGGGANWMIDKGDNQFTEIQHTDGKVFDSTIIDT